MLAKTPKAIAIIAENIPYIKENLCAKEKIKELIPGFFTSNLLF